MNEWMKDENILWPDGREEISCPKLHFTPLPAYMAKKLNKVFPSLLGHS